VARDAALDILGAAFGVTDRGDTDAHRHAALSTGRRRLAWSGPQSMPAACRILAKPRHRCPRASRRRTARSASALLMRTG